MSEIGPPPPEGRIRVERRGAVMLIGIDRPAKLNGFTPEMIDQLSHAYQRFEDDADARAAVLHAVGPHFSAGLQLDLELGTAYYKKSNYVKAIASLKVMK